MISKFKLLIPFLICMRFFKKESMVFGVVSRALGSVLHSLK